MAEIDVNKIGATVASITPATADADVRLEATEHGPEFVFSFKLPAGADGKDGTNVIGITLTDENIWVPCLDDGTPDPDLKEHVSTKILLKDGDKTITKGVTYSLTYPEESNFAKATVDDAGDVEIQLTKESPNNINIFCNVTYQNKLHQKVLSIKKSIGTPVYKVVPDVSSIKQPDGQPVIPSELRVDVIKGNGKEGVLANEDKQVYYNFELMDGTVGSKLSAQDGDGDDHKQWIIGLQNYNNYKTLDVFIEDDYGIVLDKQSIAIVKDGIGMITAHAYTVVPATMNLSKYTVKGGTYHSINDASTYESLQTMDDNGDEVFLNGSPSNSNQRDDTQAVWMISQVFASTDDQTAEHVWSYPIKLQDSDVFQVEYSTNETETTPTPLSLESLINALVADGATREELTSEILEEKGREYESTISDEKGNPGIGSDTATNPKWMATCRMQNGYGSDGTVTKCRGEVGYSAVQLELSDDVALIPCVSNEDGFYVIDPDLFTSEDGSRIPIAETEVLLIDGHEEVFTSENITKISITCSDTNIGNNTVDGLTEMSVSKDSEELWGEFKNIPDEEGKDHGYLRVYDISQDITKFKIEVEYKNVRSGETVPYAATFTINKIKNATSYKITSNCTNVKIDAVQNAYPNTLNIQILKGDGQKGVEVQFDSLDTLQSLGFNAECSGKSNSIQTEDVNEIPTTCVSIESNTYKIDITNDNDEWKNGLPGVFTFSFPIKNESGETIANEAESIPVISDGVNVDGVYEYYAVSDTQTAPTWPNNAPTEGKDNDYNYIEGFGDGQYNQIPELTLENPYLWNIEVVVNSGGDVVTVTEPALLGTYGSDGMTPYAVLEFYDTSASLESEAGDDLEEYIYYDKKTTSGTMPLPSSAEPFLYGFERVLYGKEGYEFAHPEVFYNVINGYKFVENPELSNDKGDETYSDQELYEKGFVKWVDSPVSLVSQIGPGSVTEQVYKYIAKGTSSNDEPGEKVLAVPTSDCGSYDDPGGRNDNNHSESSNGNGGTDGIPDNKTVYDFDGNFIEDYDQSKHGGKILYMSLRIFTTNGELPQDENGRPAVIASDIDGKVDYEWAAGHEDESELKPPGDSSGTEANPSPGRNEPQENSVGMAVRHMSSNGVGEKGAVSKIKGDKGDPGEDGKDGADGQDGKDGADGKDGENGIDSIYLELTNDSEMVPSDGNGVVDSTGKSSTTMQLYMGGLPITTAVTYSAYIGNTPIAVTNKTVTVNSSLVTDLKTDIVCKAKYGSATYSKTFTLTKSLGATAFKIIPSTTTIKQKGETFTPESVSVNVVGGSNGKYTTAVNYGEIQYSFDGNVGNTGVSVTPSDGHTNIFFKLINTDGVVMDEETIVILKDGEDGQDGKDGEDGADGKDGISPSITKTYALSSNGSTAPSSFPYSGPQKTTTTNKYCGCKETVTQSSGTTTSTYVISVHGETGPAGVGSTGAQGPIIYPAGAGNAYSSYELTMSEGEIIAVPYVFGAGAETKTDAYYKLLSNVDESTSGNASPKDDTNHGQKIEYFDSIFADVGMFNQATVGSFVFHGDYIFSQEGDGHIYGQSGAGVVTYKDFSNPKEAIQTYFDGKTGTTASDDTGFMPNLCFNAKDGRSILAQGKIYSGKQGTLFYGGISNSIGSTLDSILSSTIGTGAPYTYTYGINGNDTICLCSKLIIPNTVVITPGVFTLNIKTVGDLQENRRLKIVLIGDAFKGTKELTITNGTDMISFLNCPVGKGTSAITEADSFESTYTMKSNTAEIIFVNDGGELRAMVLE